MAENAGGEHVRLGERGRRAGAVGLRQAADRQVFAIFPVLQQPAADQQADVLQRSALLSRLRFFGALTAAAMPAWS